MLGVEIEFGNNWTLSETTSYKLTKAKTPARTLGFQNSVVARGGIEPPTQGFSIQYSPSFDYRFQTVKSPNQNVAHNMCL